MLLQLVGQLRATGLDDLAVGEDVHVVRLDVRSAHTSTTVRARSGLSAAIDRMPHKEQKIVHNRLCEWERSIAATLENIKRRAEAA